MKSNLIKYNTVIAEDFDSQYTLFRSKKARRIWNARIKGGQALQEALDLKFTHFPQRAANNYGHCDLKDIPVSFIPNTLQLHTQDCFKHRKDK